MAAFSLPIDYSIFCTFAKIMEHYGNPNSKPETQNYGTT